MRYKLLAVFGLFPAIFGCTRPGSGEIREYISFENNSWYRFRILSFNLPIEKPGKTYDIHFYAYYTQEFEFENLDFNMIMKTPSGEERIREYQVKIRNRDGSFTNECKSDSCEATVVLKSELSITRSGILRIELENLIPRMEINGLKGVGILLKPVG
jgi:gliding motility-associated lipoprotein GldH